MGAHPVRAFVSHGVFAHALRHGLLHLSSVCTGREPVASAPRLGWKDAPGWTGAGAPRSRRHRPRVTARIRGRSSEGRSSGRRHRERAASGCRDPAEADAGACDVTRPRAVRSQRFGGCVLGRQAARHVGRAPVPFHRRTGRALLRHGNVLQPGRTRVSRQELPDARPLRRGPSPPRMLLSHAVLPFGEDRAGRRGNDPDP